MNRPRKAARIAGSVQGEGSRHKNADSPQRQQTKARLAGARSRQNLKEQEHDGVRAQRQREERSTQENPPTSDGVFAQSLADGVVVGLDEVEEGDKYHEDRLSRQTQGRGATLFWRDVGSVLLMRC